MVGVKNKVLSPCISLRSRSAITQRCNRLENTEVVLVNVVSSTSIFKPKSSNYNFSKISLFWDSSGRRKTKEKQKDE